MLTPTTLSIACCGSTRTYYNKKLNDPLTILKEPKYNLNVYDRSRNSAGSLKNLKSVGSKQVAECLVDWLI